jgi:hypothetical protein
MFFIENFNYFVVSSTKSSTIVQGPMTTLHDYRSILGQHLDNSFRLSQFHGHSSWP